MEPHVILDHFQTLRHFHRTAVVAAVAVICLVPSAASATSHEVAQASAGDTAWMLVATALVLLMTIPGLLLFYGGMVRKKNALTMMIQGLSVTCVATIVWMVIGYSLAFTEGNNIIGGLGQVFLRDLTPESLTGTIPESVFISFQMTFAIITPVLMVGAFVSRMKFAALLIFVTAWLIVVYAPIAHWVRDRARRRRRCRRWPKGSRRRYNPQTPRSPDWSRVGIVPCFSRP